MKRFLVRHLGNMGDMVFLIPPVLATLKERHPGCHITFVAPWGFKDKRGRWGKRNQGGFTIHLMMTNPHIDQLVHWHDTKLSLEGNLCYENEYAFPTWSQSYYQQQKDSEKYDGVFELDFGLKVGDNPLARMYQAISVPDATFANYQLYLTDQDRAVAAEVMAAAPRPRLVLLEGTDGIPTRNWDSGKVPPLTAAIKQRYGVEPLWFGSRHIPYFHGRPLTLRENIATLAESDAAIGVLSGPLHFAAAVGLPTLTLYCDHPLRRAAPAYFLNRYIKQAQRRHRTLLGPAGSTMKILKSKTVDTSLTPAEAKSQKFSSWLRPGRQSTKSGLAVITVNEIMLVLNDMIA
jgi:hypothetical protein